MGTSTTITNAATRAPADWDAALVELYAENYDSLVRSARRYLHDTETAEEAVQDAFVHYHVRSANQVAEQPMAYLRTMVVNNARNTVRRRVCREAHRAVTIPNQRSIEDVCVANERAQALSSACATLPVRQRAVLILRYWHGLSEAEVATKLGISVGSVKTHAYRGRSALRNALAAAAA